MSVRLDEILRQAALEVAPVPCGAVKPPASLITAPREMTVSTRAGDGDALVRGVVHVHVVGRDAERLPGRRVVDDDVGVGAGRDARPCAGTGRTSARAWWSTTRPSARGSARRPRPLGRSGPCGARHCRCRWGSWRSCRAPAPSGPSCRTGSGRWRRRRGRWCAAPATGPSGATRAWTAAASSRRSSAPSKPGRAEVVLEVEVEVLRAGLGEDVGAGVAGGGDLVQRLGRREVHDVERAARRPRPA